MFAALFTKACLLHGTCSVTKHRKHKLKAYRWKANQLHLVISLHFSSYACTVGCGYNAEACLADTLQYDAHRFELKMSQEWAWSCPCGVSIDMAYLPASKDLSKLSSSCCYSEVTGAAAYMKGHCLVACLQMPSLPSHIVQCRILWLTCCCAEPLRGKQPKKSAMQQAMWQSLSRL